VLGQAWEQQLCLIQHHHCKHVSLRALYRAKDEQVVFEHAAFVVLLSASCAFMTGAKQKEFCQHACLA